MLRLPSALDAQQRPVKNAHGRCEADVTPVCHAGYRGSKLHTRDGSARCRRIAVYEHSGKRLCPSHAGMIALEIVLAQDALG